MTKKRFTVGYMMEQDGSRRASKPCVKFGGSWLKAFGIDVGDKLELIEGRNMLVLVKVSNDA